MFRKSSGFVLIVAVFLLGLGVKSFNSPAFAQSCEHPVNVSIGSTAQIKTYGWILRAEPGLGDGDFELPRNAQVQILDGPVCEDGINFWYVTYNGVSGWYPETSVHGNVELTVLGGQPVPPVHAPSNNTTSSNTYPQPDNSPNSEFCEIRMGVDQEAAPSGTRFNFWIEARTASGAALGIRAVRFGTGDVVLGELGATSMQGSWDSSGRGPGGVTFWAEATTGNWPTGCRAEMNVQVRPDNSRGPASTDWADNCRQIGCNGQSGGVTNPPASYPTTNTCNSQKGLVVGDIVVISDATPGAARLRSGPSTDNQVVTEIPVRTAITLIGGPQCGSGYVWWETQYSGSTGWTAEVNVIKNGDPLPGGSSGGGSTNNPPAPSNNPSQAVVPTSSEECGPGWTPSTNVSGW